MSRYQMGLDALGVLSLGTPKLKIDTSFATASATASTPLTVEQLLAVDRKLTPEEQARVDAYQSAQGDAMQAKEEATPFVNPLTGQKSKVAVTYSTSSSPAAALGQGTPWWVYLLGGLGAAGVAAGIYGIVRR